MVGKYYPVIHRKNIDIIFIFMIQRVVGVNVFNFS